MVSGVLVAERKSSELDSIKNDVRSLSSKVDLIIQKINTIEKNEQVLGRTVVTLNEKLKGLQSSGSAQGSSDSASSAVSEAALDKKYALKSELKELKYTLDMINPLQFATIDQVKEMLKDAIGKE